MTGVAAVSLMVLCLEAGLTPALGTAAAVLLWLAPAFYPTDLKRPRGFGAWALWTVWTAVAAFFCREPLMAARVCVERASGVVLFALAYSWWGRPHRRAWLALLWGAAAAWGGYCVYAVRYDVAAAGLLIAALGSCARACAAEIQEGYWRGLAAGLTALFLALPSAFLARAGAPSLTRTAQAWRSGLAQASAQPVTGVGPGLFAKGALRYGAAPKTGPRSQWVGGVAETGVVGLALFFIAILFSLPQASSREWERRAAGGAFLGLAAFSMFEEVLKSPALSVLWFSALACAAPGFEEQEARPFRLSRPTAVLGAVLSLACALPGYYVRRAGGTDADLERAAALSPADAALSAELARRDLLKAPPELGLALAHLDRAIEDSPRDPALLRRKADLFRLVRAEPEARMWEDRAAALERDAR